MEVQVEYLRAVFNYLTERKLCPHWCQQYGDQHWIELRYDCDRRKPAATENPKLEISIQGDVVTLIVTGIDQLEQTSRWMEWPRIDLNDPESFEQVRDEVLRFEKIVEQSLEAGYAGQKVVDSSAIISAYGPRPRMYDAKLR